MFPEYMIIIIIELKYYHLYNTLKEWINTDKILEYPYAFKSFVHRLFEVHKSFYRNYVN